MAASETSGSLLEATGTPPNSASSCTVDGADSGCVGRKTAATELDPTAVLALDVSVGPAEGPTAAEPAAAAAEHSSVKSPRGGSVVPRPDAAVDAAVAGADGAEDAKPGNGIHAGSAKLGSETAGIGRLGSQLVRP